MQTLKDMLAAVGGGEMTPGGGLPQNRPEPRKLKDWQKIMGVLGSGLTALGGGRPTFARNLIEERQRAEEMQQQWDLAERQGQQRMAEKLWERANPTPTAEMRNFGEWQNWDPETRALYDQYNPVTVSTWQGPVAVPRSSLARPEIGSIVPDPRRAGQNAPTMQNTPAPQMNASGVPTFLTPDQYRVTVEALGKERTDDWMRRHNIRIGGQ